MIKLLSYHGKIIKLNTTYQMGENRHNLKKKLDSFIHFFKKKSICHL